MLARLGLRGEYILGMRLGDIEWDQGDSDVSVAKGTEKCDFHFHKMLAMHCWNILTKSGRRLNQIASLSGYMRHSSLSHDLLPSR